MESLITRNVFCTYTGDDADVGTTIFFISGNPGLISYYHPFLSLLARHLAENGESSGQKPASFRIYGCSLGGFEVAESSVAGSTSQLDTQGNTGNGSRLYDLEEQICFVQGKLNQVMESSSGKKQSVILIGHSVGTYMAMEILRRHREATAEPPQCAANAKELPDFDIIGGIMLFPTVMDIAASPSGQKLTVCFFAGENLLGYSITNSVGLDRDFLQ